MSRRLQDPRWSRTSYDEAEWCGSGCPGADGDQSFTRSDHRERRAASLRDGRLDVKGTLIGTFVRRFEAIAGCPPYVRDCEYVASRPWTLARLQARLAARSPDAGELASTALSGWWRQ
jgi:hypothetical protein